MYFIDYRIVYSKENRSFHYVNPNRFFLPFSIGQGTSKVSLVMPDFSFRINQQDLAWIKGEAGRKKLGKKEQNRKGPFFKSRAIPTTTDHAKSQWTFSLKSILRQFSWNWFLAKIYWISCSVKMKLNSNWPKLINDTIS